MTGPYLGDANCIGVNRFPTLDGFVRNVRAVAALFSFTSFER